MNENEIILASLLEYREYLKKLRIYGSDILEYSEILDRIKSVNDLITKYEGKK